MFINSKNPFFVRRILFKKWRSVISLLLCSFVIIFVLFRRLNKPQRYDWYERVLKSLDTSRVNTAVVEEHHEVLQYWYGAVHTGILPSSDNILIHIDAHSDTGVPAYHPDMFEFSVPHSASDIHKMMLRNDAFILAAAYKKLFHTIVWVYPDWLILDDIGDASKSGVKTSISLGHFQNDNNGGKLGNCACYIAIEENDDCSYVDEVGYPIDNYEGECHFIMEISMFYTKVSLAKRVIGSLMTQTAGAVLLDIDEDFYGVMKGSDLLPDIEFNYIRSLNNILSKAFDVTNVNEEYKVHSLLLTIINLIKSVCSAAAKNRHKCSTTQIKDIYKHLQYEYEHLMTMGGRYLAKEVLHNLILYINDVFSDTDLEKICHVGFCLAISPQTYELFNKHPDIGYRSVVVCHGRNDPQTLNQIRNTTLLELPSLSNDISSVVDVIPVERVRFITICRSNRDGYTPRHLQPDIEQQVLGIIRDRYPNTHYIYDQSLMVHLNTATNC